MALAKNKNKDTLVGKGYKLSGNSFELREEAGRIEVQVRRGSNNSKSNSGGTPLRPKGLRNQTAKAAAHS